MSTLEESLESSRAVVVPIGPEGGIEADLIIPKDPKGLVILVHGSWSSRLSPRNRFIARILRDQGLATFLLDAETPGEREKSVGGGEAAIDLQEEARRICLAFDWLAQDEEVSKLPKGLMGAGTGAAATFIAAANNPVGLRAIVARAGRLESIHPYLPRVAVPSLLIVGARDTEVVHGNIQALGAVATEKKRLEVIPGARHLFEEPGALAAVAMHAGGWLSQHVPIANLTVETHAVVASQEK